MRAEISAKFRPEGVTRELAATGWWLDAWMTDRRGDYAVSLAMAA
jgi:L-histidine N-alpha-methyltransferase